MQFILLRYLECGPVYVIWAFHRPVIVAADPESVKVNS